MSLGDIVREFNERCRASQADPVDSSPGTNDSSTAAAARKPSAPVEDDPPPPPPPPAPEEAFSEVRNSIMLGSGVSEQAASLLAFWCMSTWLQDKLEILPCLVITGPATIGDRILTSLAPWVLNCGTVAGFQPPAILKAAGWSLLISAPGLTDRQASLLGTLTNPAFGTLVPDGWERSAHAFAVYAGPGPLPFRIQHSIHLHVPVSGPWQPQISGRYGYPPRQRPLVQQYRAAWLYELVPLEAPLTGLSPEAAEIVNALGQCLPHALELQKKLVALVGENDRQQSISMSGNAKTLVVEATLALSRGSAAMLYARQIADECNRILRDRGERLTVSSEKVGRTLHQLGLPTRRLSKAGNGLVLDRVMLQSIRQTATMYGVEVEDEVPQLANLSEPQTSANQSDKKGVEVM